MENMKTKPSTRANITMLTLAAAVAKASVMTILLEKQLAVMIQISFALRLKRNQTNVIPFRAN